MQQNLNPATDTSTAVPETPAVSNTLTLESLLFLSIFRYS